jgi:ATP-binding cassette, subfamily B, multidrug efflux pump
MRAIGNVRPANGWRRPGSEPCRQRYHDRHSGRRFESLRFDPTADLPSGDSTRDRMTTSTPSDADDDGEMAGSAPPSRTVRRALHPGPDASPGQGLWMYMRQHRRWLIVGALLTAGGAFASTLPPVLIGRIVDSLGQPDLSVIVGMGAAIIGLTVVQALLQAGGRYMTVITARDIEYEMRDDLFAHLQRMDLAYFQHRRIGDLMARMTNDLNAVRMMLAGGQVNFVATAAVVVFTVVAMAGVSLPLTVISLVVPPFISLTLAVVGRIVNRRFEELQARFGDISAAAQENMSGIRVVKAFAQEPAEVNAFREVCNRYLAGAIHLARAQQFIWPAMEGILGLATLLVLMVGGQQAVGGQLTIGQLVQFVAYLRLLAWPLVSLGWVSNLFQSGWASLRRLQELWTARPAIHDEPGASADPVRGEVEFRDVIFRYGDAGPVLRGLNFRVPVGSSLAVVGATGAGKSTLVNLVPRLFDVADGQVLVDGIDVRLHTLAALRQSIGYVPQETFLFSMPLRTNVGFGHSHDLSERDLNAAGEIAQLNEDVMTFPERYDTIIGERGVTLSGGQKQRTALARAIAKGPRILILDDAFSAVDTHTEAEILRRLADVRKGRTTILVAHRISTVKDCDQIIVLADGAIAEQGTHQELLAARGRYYAMHRRQQLEDRISRRQAALGLDRPAEAGA